METSLIKKIQRTRTSSVLNRDVKQFGKQFLFDGDEETCWNSDQGNPQFILIEFEEEVAITALHIQFQGGFAGKECWLEGAKKDGGMEKIHEFYPENQNQLQVFELPTKQTLQKIKIVFNSSTDFFGRITIYKLDILDCS